MLLGAHVYVGDGYQRTLEYALEVGCECVQIFAKSPRQWSAPPLDADKAMRFVEARREVGFGPVFTHTAYLINLGTVDPALRDKSIDALADELARASMLQAEAVVTHVGTDSEADPLAAAARVAEAILAARQRANVTGHVPRLLLENSAGAGRSFGGSFAELGACIDAARLASAELGVCFDTCHGFAYGYPLETEDGWSSVLAEMDAEFGLDRLGLIHPNDCLYPRGSHRDRHAWVGDGEIGSAGFSAMVCRQALRDVCACLEVPGEMPLKDAENIGRLRAMRDRCDSSQEAQ